MNHASMAGLEIQGIASHGPMPSGMLRIRKDHQEKYVWPVHLPGWLSMGWRVAGQGSELAETPPLTPAAIAEPAPLLEPEASSAHPAPAEPPAAQARGRRGRPRKEKVDAAPAEPAGESTPEAASEAAEPADGAAPTSDTGTDPEAVGPLDTDPAEPLLTALPDDLFNDPLI